MILNFKINYNYKKFKIIITNYDFDDMRRYFKMYTILISFLKKKEKREKIYRDITHLFISPFLYFHFPPPLNY